MSNKVLKIIILILLIAGIGYFFKNNNDLSPTKKDVPTSSQNQGGDYLKIDSKLINENKFDYYSNVSGTNEKIPDDLKDFLIGYIKDKPKAEYQDTCLKNKSTCNESSEFSSTAFDLNGDGDKEYIILAFQVCGCSQRGASGNGDILIVKQDELIWKVVGILHGNGFLVSKRKTNGYNDILTNSHSSAATGKETLYKWETVTNGQETGGTYEEIFSKNYDLSR